MTGSALFECLHPHAKVSHRCAECKHLRSQQPAQLTHLVQLIAAWVLHHRDDDLHGTLGRVVTQQLVHTWNGSRYHLVDERV